MFGYTQIKPACLERVAENARGSASALSAAVVFRKREPNGAPEYYGEPSDQTVLPATKRVQRDLDHTRVPFETLVAEQSNRRREVS